MIAKRKWATTANTDKEKAYECRAYHKRYNAQNPRPRKTDRRHPKCVPWVRWKAEAIARYPDDPDRAERICKYLDKRRKQRERAQDKEYRQRTAAHRKEYNREYLSRPEVKQRRSAYEREYRSDPDNIEKRRAYEREYRSDPKNKQRMDTYHKEYNAKHSGKIKAKAAQYYLDNREKIRARESTPEAKAKRAAHNKWYHEKFKDKIAKQAKRYRTENAALLQERRDKIRDKLRARDRERRAMYQAERKTFFRENPGLIRGWNTGGEAKVNANYKLKSDSKGARKQAYTSISRAYEWSLNAFDYFYQASLASGTDFRLDIPPEHGVHDFRVVVACEVKHTTRHTQSDTLIKMGRAIGQVMDTTDTSTINDHIFRMPDGRNPLLVLFNAKPDAIPPKIIKRFDLNFYRHFAVFYMYSTDPSLGFSMWYRNQFEDRHRVDFTPDDPCTHEMIALLSGKNNPH